MQQKAEAHQDRKAAAPNDAHLPEKGPAAKQEQIAH